MIADQDRHSFTEKISSDDWLAEMALLRTKLSKHGITDVQTGMELEFTAQDGGQRHAHVRENVQAFRRDIEEQIAHSEGEKNAELLSKFEQMRKFNVAEWMMYDLIEKDPATKDMLQYSFGKGLLGEGYYDNPGIFEIRLKHGAPESMCTNHTILMQELARKMEEYGLVMGEKPNRQISVSFWKGDDNIMDNRSPEHTGAGMQATEGMLRVFHDAIGAIRHPDIEGFPPYIDVGIGRNSHFRLAEGRLEIKLPYNASDYQHPEAITTLAMAGALHGLEAHAKKSLSGLVPARKIERFFFKEKGNDAPYLLQYMNTMQRMPNGNMEGNSFLLDGMPKMCAELGIFPKDSAQYERMEDEVNKVLDGKTPSAEYQQIRSEMLDRLSKITCENGELHFPESLQHLQGKIELAGQATSFDIRNAYKFDTRAPKVDAASRIDQSQALWHTLSPKMFEQLCTQAEAEFGKPSHTDQVRMERGLAVVAEQASERRGIHRGIL